MRFLPEQLYSFSKRPRPLTLIVLVVFSLLTPLKTVRADLFVMDEVLGDLKLFYFANGPVRGDVPQAISMALPSLTEGSSGGIMTARIKLKGEISRLSWEIHPLLSALPNNSTSGVSLNPNATQVSEAIPLSFNFVDSQQLRTQMRADRFNASLSLGPTKFKLGRQAITLGQGRIFTPLDRINPFIPTSVDQEYKPGVDALRFDVWWGIAGQLSLISAYRGGWDQSGMLYAVDLRDSFFQWDVSITWAQIQEDQMIGGSFAGSLGPVNLYGDGSWTCVPSTQLNTEEDQDFVRGVLGGSWSWSEWHGGSLTLEVAWQGDGAQDVNAYAQEELDPRRLRGERWLLSQLYTALSIQQNLSPLLSTGLTLIQNLNDQSTLAGTQLGWSISDDASASLGGYFGVGDGLDNLRLQSEFGALTWMFFGMMSAYY